MIDGFQLTAEATFFNGGVTGAAALGVAAVGLAGVSTLVYGIGHPRASLFGKVISEGAPGATGIALTFDDGPTPGSTERVLDILGEHRVFAAFFVIGQNAQRWPALVQRMHDEGHIVANHTFDHAHNGCWHRFAYWEKELPRANDAIQQIIGRRPALFRPPMGLKTWHLMMTAKRVGLTTVTWTRKAWDTKPTTTEAILEKLSPSKAGEIILMHDGIEPHGKPRDPKATCDALGTLIQRFRERGIEPARLDALIRTDAYQAVSAQVRRFEKMTPLQSD